jgi:L-malate glycosyltransferase
VLNGRDAFPQNSLRLGYLIDNLNAGGAERQLSELAVGMVARGHSVEIFCYNIEGEGTYDQFVRDHGVILHRMAGRSKWHKIRGIRKWVEAFQPHILHGFMKRASSLAVLANLPGRRFGVVASDFSTATYAPFKPSLWGALVLFHLADCVVTETVMNRDSLGRLAPTLKGKLVVIRNGVDNAHFGPGPKPEGEVFRFLCVATVSEVKNPVRVVEALRILRQQTDRPFVFDWVGRYRGHLNGEPTNAYVRARQLIDEYGLQDLISFKGPSPSVVDEYRKADALVHVSVQEGIPNAVVEGMACGLPIVVSRISDLPLLVAAGENGITCDAFDPNDIARAMKAMLEFQIPDRYAMGCRSQKLANDWFGIQRFITEHEIHYQRIVDALKNGRGSYAP